MAQTTLYILYNADGTFFGKLKYGYCKLSKSGPESECAVSTLTREMVPHSDKTELMVLQACDITHGGLSLSESPQWLDSKKEIEGHGVKVVQWHRDEISPDLKGFVKSNGIRYPAVVLGTAGGSYTTIMTSADLNACAGEPKALVNELYKKDILPGNLKKTGLSSI